MNTDGPTKRVLAIWPDVWVELPKMEPDHDIYDYEMW